MPRHRNHERQHRNVELLDAIAEGQQQRTVLEDTRGIYIAKCRVMTRILNELDGVDSNGDNVRQLALELDQYGNAIEHTGAARGVYRLKLPMLPATAKRLFAAISVDTSLPRKRRRDREEIEQEVAVDDLEAEVPDRLNPARNLQTVCAQTYQNYKSALKWWHKHHDPVTKGKVGSEWPAAIDEQINQQIASYKRDVGLKKRRGIMRQKEGKSAFNLTGYMALCDYFNRMRPAGHHFGWMEGVFAQLFTKLSVNTIGRSDNIDDLLLQNIDWENDALTIVFGNTKSDIEGESTADKKRLYANPFLPEICVILSFAIYTWCKHRPLNGSIHLFDGGEQNKRYYKQMVQALKDIPEHIDMGCKRCDIGTHSSRKFAESTSASKIDGPSKEMVCLRAGQSVGRTQDCYMKAEQGGDALVGRTVAQLKFDADEFDVLPPHFGPDTLRELNDRGWETILPCYGNLPESYQRAVPYLFASLVYHHHSGNLQRIGIPQDSILYSQSILTDPFLINDLKEKVILCHGYCTATQMSAQGVPGFITIQREVRMFRAHYDDTCRQNQEHYEALSSKMNTLLDALPDRVVSVILDHIRVEGAQPVTLNSIRSMITEMLTSDAGPIANLSRGMNAIADRLNCMNTGSIQINSQEVDHQQPVMTTGRIHFWPGDDRIHHVPLGFKWPMSKNTMIMWNYWFFGEAVKDIGPYKFIPPSDDLTTKQCKTNRSRAAKVINILVTFAVNAGKIRSQREVVVGNSTDIFDFAFGELMKRAYPDRPDKRGLDLTVCAVYERWRKINGDQIQNNHIN